ncbi:unnamed protein product [Amaranthus hypochondriacus]
MRNPIFHNLQPKSATQNAPENTLSGWKEAVQRTTTKNKEVIRLGSMEQPASTTLHEGQPKPVQALVTGHSKETDPKPPSPHGQLPVQHPQPQTKSPTPLPSTPETTTKIFSTNAAREMVITTIEVNKDPRMLGDPTTSKGYLLASLGASAC